RAEYKEDIDLVKIASETIVDAIVQPENLRKEIATRLARAEGKREERPRKKHMVVPVLARPASVSGVRLSVGPVLGL
ncbi:hypothetical protein, partial [Sulfitobacter sp. CW3]|uniref:hypothetical protein n=1 Tax=Sulfitobacter sp. CW3 TaxID=2861965 RepID=UPI001C5E78FF